MGQKICPLLQVTFPCQICPSGIRLVTETMECLSQSWTLVQNTLGLDGHGELLRRRPLCTGSRPDRRPGHQLEVHLWGRRIMPALIKLTVAPIIICPWRPVLPVSLMPILLTWIVGLPKFPCIFIIGPRFPSAFHQIRDFFQLEWPPSSSSEKCAKLDALPRNWCYFQSVSECSDVPEHLNEQL